MSPEKEFLSLEEVADTLGVTYQLIYRLVRSGEMPAARVGKLYRVSRTDLNSYLEKTKKTAMVGGVCGACGTAYQSRMSLTQACVECGEPICVDCWHRKEVRHCAKHAPGKDK
jgi:excisionase family DNA binding protein